MHLPARKLLIVIADRCPWHVLLVDMMSTRLREQGVTCGVIGLVEQGILDAANIAGLRRLADKTGGAWDLANGRELRDAIHSLGLHLYRKAGSKFAICEIVVLDHGPLMVFRDRVEVGVRRLTESLTNEQCDTALIFHWHTVPTSRLHWPAKKPPVQLWKPPPLDQLPQAPVYRPPLEMDDRKAILPTLTPKRPSAIEKVSVQKLWQVRSVLDGARVQRPEPDVPGRAPGRVAPVDRAIQWGLWLSGGALLSALTLLAKK